MNTKKRIIPLLFFLSLLAPIHAQKTVEVKVDVSKLVGKLEPFWASQIIHPTVDWFVFFLPKDRIMTNCLNK